MNGTGLMAALLDQDLAGHLAVALKRHREALADAGRARPPGLADLEALAVEAARGGQGQPGAAPRRRPEDHGLHDREWLSPRDVAAVTGLSLTTVRRHLKSGKLLSTKVGGRRLTARCDLHDFMNRRRSGSGGGRTPVRLTSARPLATAQVMAKVAPPGGCWRRRGGLGRDRPTRAAPRLRGPGGRSDVPWRLPRQKPRRASSG